MSGVTLSHGGIFDPGAKGVGPALSTFNRVICINYLPSLCLIFLNHKMVGYLPCWGFGD